ncbi:ABC transporter ATP-binding protein [Actinomyces oris]|uniref:ABC transporter ATP-binding protein n=1 Tax=Actinomyces oris TaxID=544580 RepID=A0A1Q8WJH4_9ACTO|nr:ABC transporter ATP-binding protein [Actinomyces oris]OLO66508.1 ABC transporter ATP-binding protein [Actinomyces oris]
MTPSNASTASGASDKTFAPAASWKAERDPLLEITDLEVAFRSSTGLVPAVRKANLTLYPGQSVAIVGESGSGKSTLAHAVIGLLPGTGRVTGGTIRFQGRDITHLGTQELTALRGSSIGLVPQDPMSNLNPVWSIGFQVKEALRANGLAGVADDRLAHLMAKRTGHAGGTDQSAPGGHIDVNEQVALLLEQAGLPEASRRAKQYPHEFSGGMRQRALIAIGLAARPDLLIADEPTSALDVTVQRRILDHLQTLVRELGTAMLFITHDLGLAAERAEHIVVMHRGRVVESGPSLEVLQDPRHPYTQRLVKAAPSLASRRIESAHARGIQVAEDELLGASLGSSSTEEILRVEHLTKVFKVRGPIGEDNTLTAVDDVSFGIRKGTTTALVGESGSGKSTVANIILNLIDPTSGKVFHDGVDLSTLGPKELFALRRIMQPVFQNPYGSLDPMYSIFRVVEEPLRVHGIGTAKEREARVAELLDMVSLPRSVMRRYPHELSGGQRQRVAIARALALKPQIVILDEAVSALDVLVQAQILRLLSDLQAELELTYLFITHDLAVVRQIADDVVVMEHGRIVESGAADELFANPRQDYTRELIRAVPGAGIDLYGDEKHEAQMTSDD